MKLKQVITFLLLATLPLFFTSCDPVENNLNRMDAIVADAEDNGSNYTPEDWEAFVADFQECQDDLSESKNELNSEDYRRFGEISARYQKVILKYSMDILKSSLEAGSSFMNGYLEEMGEGIDLEFLAEDYEDALEGYSEKMDKLFE